MVSYLLIKWEGAEFTLPVIANQDGFFLVTLFCHSMPLQQRMLKKFLDNISMECVSDIEHKVSVALSSLWIGTRDVHSHPR